MGIRRLLPLCAVLAALLVAPAAALGGEDGTAGSIRTLKGQATVVRQETSLTAEMGMHIMSGDVLRTGPESSLGVLFRDDTSLSMGPESQVTVDEFVFDPAAGNMSMLTSVMRGTAAFVSGQMAKLKPEAVVVSSPLATIGIRGTRFVVHVEEQ